MNSKVDKDYEKLIIKKELAEKSYKLLSFFGDISAGQGIIGKYSKDGQIIVIKSYHKDNRNEKVSRDIGMTQYIQNNIKKCEEGAEFVFTAYGIIKTKNYYHIIMEAMTGDFFTFIHKYKTKMSMDFKLDLFRSLLLGLRCLHRIGIIHGDLKPENIFIKYRRRTSEIKIDKIVIADFDCSKLNTTKQRLLCATPNFLPPELFDFNRRMPALGRAVYESDIYVMGLILYEMFSRIPEFDTKRIRNIEMHVRSDKNVPTFIKNIIIAMTKIKPDNRICLDAAIISIEKYLARNLQTVLEEKTDLDKDVITEIYNKTITERVDEIIQNNSCLNKVINYILKF